MSSRHVLVLGAGGHAGVVISTLQSAGRLVDAILDDDPHLLGNTICGVPVTGKMERAHEFRDLEAIIAIGENHRRRELAVSLNLDWTIAVHPSAVVYPEVAIGPGSVVFAGAVIQPGATVGAHAIINTGSTVDHDCAVGSFAHLAPGSHLGGGVRVGDGAFIGIGACVLPNCHVGQWAVLGGGAVAIGDVPCHMVAVGVPAIALHATTGANGTGIPHGKRPPVHGSAEIQWAFIGPDDARWRAVLDCTEHDVYHLPEYAALMAKQEQKQAFAFYATNGEKACLIPLLRRQLPDRLDAPSTWCDLQSPYGYPSPLFTHPQDSEAVEGLLKTFVAASNELGACSVFLRLHPLLSAGHRLPDQPLRCHTHGQTVSIDLTKDEEEMWLQTRNSHRCAIHRLERLNFTAPTDDWSLLDDFIRMYRQTMLRVGANSYYEFGDEYFAGLKAALNGKLHLCCVLSPEGVAVAGGLFTAVGKIMQYHLSGSDPEFHHVAPTKLMLHAMRRWGREHGYSVLHLGGGLGADRDALFQFKAGFSKDVHTFQTCRIIANEQRYSILTLRAGLCLHPTADLDSSYFPPYY